MVLEYAGPKLALVEWASGMRLTVLLALLANLFVPWGIAGTDPAPITLLIGVAAVAAKVIVLAVALAFAEVFIAKLRLFRVQVARRVVPVGSAGGDVGQLLHRIGVSRWSTT